MNGVIVKKISDTLKQHPKLKKGLTYVLVYWLVVFFFTSQGSFCMLNPFADCPPGDFFMAAGFSLFVILFPSFFIFVFLGLSPLVQTNFYFALILQSLFWFLVGTVGGKGKTND